MFLQSHTKFTWNLRICAHSWASEHRVLFPSVSSVPLILFSARPCPCPVAIGHADRLQEPTGVHLSHGARHLTTVPKDKYIIMTRIIKKTWNTFICISLGLTSYITTYKELIVCLSWFATEPEMVANVSGPVQEFFTPFLLSCLYISKKGQDMLKIQSIWQLLFIYKSWIYISWQRITELTVWIFLASDFEACHISKVCLIPQSLYLPVSMVVKKENKNKIFWFMDITAQSNYNYVTR